MLLPSRRRPTARPSIGRRDSSGSVVVGVLARGRRGPTTGTVNAGAHPRARTRALRLTCSAAARVSRAFVGGNVVAGRGGCRLLRRPLLPRESRRRTLVPRHRRRCRRHRIPRRGCRGARGGRSAPPSRPPRIRSPRGYISCAALRAVVVLVVVVVAPLLEEVARRHLALASPRRMGFVRLCVKERVLACASVYKRVCARACVCVWKMDGRKEGRWGACAGYTCMRDR